MDPTCIKKVIMQNPWNPWLLLKVPKQLQFKISPPDLGQRTDPSCAAKVAEQYRFHEEYDHNGGRCASAIIAIRVNPLPKGTRDFEWERVREQFISHEQVVVFGALKLQKAK
jgi:hypothetical protein